MPDPIIAYTEFNGPPMRPVYERPDGRQYVLDDDGEPVYGVWFVPREEADVAMGVRGQLTKPLPQDYRNSCGNTANQAHFRGSSHTLASGPRV
jgi:hypothetical protein